MLNPNVVFQTIKNRIQKKFKKIACKLLGWPSVVSRSVIILVYKIKL